MSNEQITLKVELEDGVITIEINGKFSPTTPRGTPLRDRVLFASRGLPITKRGNVIIADTNGGHSFLKIFLCTVSIYINTEQDHVGTILYSQKLPDNLAEQYYDLIVEALTEFGEWTHAIGKGKQITEERRAASEPVKLVEYYIGVDQETIEEEAEEEEQTDVVRTVSIWTRFANLIFNRNT